MSAPPAAGPVYDARAAIAPSARAVQWPRDTVAILMHDEQEDAPQFDSPGETSEIIRGPHAWLNWFAERAGQPRRTEAHPETSVINPIWEEFALYTDAPIDPGRRWLQLGPYELVAPDPTARAQFGVARRALILRAWDHVSDAPPPPGTLSVGDDIDYYIGGDIGDELAALLSVVTGRRVRSGGSVQLGLPPADPVGLPMEGNHHAPALAPPRRAAMIPLECPGFDGDLVCRSSK